MAEIAVDLVIGKLMPLLRYEVTILTEVHSQVAFIKDQLSLIRAYLRDADVKAEKEEKSNVVKEWVKQVREVAHRIEDVIDDYLLQVAQRRHRCGIAGVLEKIAQLLRSIELRHSIASEIREINDEISALDKRKDTLGIVRSGDESSAHSGEKGNSSSHTDLRRGTFFLEDTKLVGIDDSKKRLKSLLLGEDCRRTVIGVVGTSGLGKTTITKKLYEKQKDKRFDCGAWITVSKTFNEKSIFKSILGRHHDQEGDDDDSQAISISRLSKDSLIRIVREFLQDKIYLIGFDDVWQEDFWGLVENVLPQNNNRSRIIITTRYKRVVEFCKCSAQVHIHELQRLSPSDAMRLFIYKAFQFKPEGGCHDPELMKLSKDIVEKCDGVPLAIVAIARLLSTMDDKLIEWKKVYDSLGSRLASDIHLKSIHRVLSESYHDLPFHLKPCLLYFGIFPNDYSIRCSRLIRLWIAEGLVDVKANQNRTPEEVAEEYLDELIRRSLVIVSSKHHDGRAKTCSVDDLLHDFVKEKCAEVDFCQVIKSDNFYFNSTTRRLSIQGSKEYGDFGRVDADYSRVRFCFVFNFEQTPWPLVNSFLSSFKLLVGLDFEDASLDALPQEIATLLHLKFLSLRNTSVKTFPRFIGKLRNLETLNLEYTRVRDLPIEINKLIKLRHLLAHSINVEIEYSLASFPGVLIKEGIGGLKALQKLLRVDMTNGDNITKELKKLKQLRTLGVTRLRRHNGMTLCSAIEGMTHLQSLIIIAEEHEILDLHALVNPPHQHLQRLHLKGCLETVPKWVPKLHVLSSLVLQWSGVKEDPLPALKDLPELLELELYTAFEGAELYFKEGWFKKLKTLSLEKMESMKSLKIDKGALPILERMTIGPCPQMVEVPPDLQNLETLQYLRFYEMPVNPWEGKACDMLKNIPYVIYSKGDKFYTLHNDTDTETDDF